MLIVIEKEGVRRLVFRQFFNSPNEPLELAVAKAARSANFPGADEWVRRVHRQLGGCDRAYDLGITWYAGREAGRGLCLKDPAHDRFVVAFAEGYSRANA